MAKPEQLANARAPRVPVPSLDLLRSFTAATALPLLRFPPNGLEEQELGDEVLELNLGLSSNGRFGVDPGSSKLVRSASISDVKNSLGGNKDCDGNNGFASGMARTCSLPVENKDNGKRKDAMTCRMRDEARRRRIEKLGDAVPCETDNSSGVSSRNGLIGSLPNRGCNEASNGCLNGYDKIGMTGQSMTLRQQLLSQLSRRRGSLESKCLEIRGMNKDTPTRSLTTVGSSQEKEHNTSGISRERYTASASEKCKGFTDDADEEGKRMTKSVMENMPCVSTKGGGPNGKKVEGFLYRYRKGEDVRIMCVCHGSFFTPAEFVKHAGLGDVAQPLKHIVVNTSSTF